MEGLGNRQQCLQPQLGLSEPKADCTEDKHNPTVELKGTPKIHYHYFHYDCHHTNIPQKL